MSAAVEMNFDGLAGPTHNYAGLAVGNLASQRNREAVSHPRQAALQGLAKMKFLADLEIPQGVLPPQERPDIRTLRRLGFGGSDADALARARREEPRLFAAVWSASAMWTANAATVSPAADTADGRVHFTPANLASQFHRSLEPPQTAAILRAIFDDESAFAHHDPLPSSAAFGDEGAANHLRLCIEHADPGLEIFVYGRDERDVTSGKFPARQSRQASAAIARLHGLNPSRMLFVRQSPRAIDAGAFHNDVVAVANRNVLLYHESAYENFGELESELDRRFGSDLHRIRVAADRVSLNDAVETYLFNSQIVDTAEGMALIAPVECRERANVAAFIEELIAADNPIRSVHFLDVRQSMRNGGGPACLRLRVVLSEMQRAAVHPGVVFTDATCARLRDWVERRYREELSPDDLADPRLIDESRQALDELTKLLGLGAIYPFQR